MLRSVYCGTECRVNYWPWRERFSICSRSQPVIMIYPQPCGYRCHCRGPLLIVSPFTFAALSQSPPSTSLPSRPVNTHTRYLEASSEESGQAFAYPIASVLSLSHVSLGLINYVLKDQYGSSSDFHSGTNAILYYSAANMAPDGFWSLTGWTWCLMPSCTPDGFRRKEGPALATLVILSVELVSC